MPASCRNIYQGKVVASLLPSESGKFLCKDVGGSNYSENCILFLSCKEAVAPAFHCCVVVGDVPACCSERRKCPWGRGKSVCSLRP